VKLLTKVCSSLVFLTYVYHDARSRECKISTDNKVVMIGKVLEKDEPLFARRELESMGQLIPDMK
jgi:hypothetical protein